jgi:hypothetical protein
MKDQTSKTSDIIPQEIIGNKILFIRGKKVMLDKDLAMLYGVETKALPFCLECTISCFQSILVGRSHLIIHPCILTFNPKKAIHSF